MGLFLRFDAGRTATPVLIRQNREDRFPQSVAWLRAFHRHQLSKSHLLTLSPHAKLVRVTRHRIADFLVLQSLKRQQNDPRALGQSDLAGSRRGYLLMYALLTFGYHDFRSLPGHLSFPR